MVRWVVTEGTAQDRFERAVLSLGAKAITRAVGGVLVEVSADLPEHFTEVIRALLLEGTSPEMLTKAMVEARMGLNKSDH